MKFDTVFSIVGSVPFITKDNAKRLYQLIIDRNITSVLELGVAHGTATCIMAAAVEENGGGMVYAVDLIEKELHYQPTLEQQLLNTGLSEYVQISRMQTGYTWFLHDEIKANTIDNHCNEIYDLCIIDGSKNWTIDGAAFFMADKLIKEHGLIIFDDYYWTYSQANKNRAETDGISHRHLSRDELETPQIKEVIELLVKQHPEYGNLTLHADSGWAIAEKTKSANKNYKVVYSETTVDVLAKFIHIIRRKIQRFFRV